MLASPFGFFRGAVAVMAADLAAMPNTGIISQICGDAHVRNLGAYAAPDGRLIFDINDFDETCAAPFEWDLKRMATSLVLAGRENGQKPSACREAVHILALNYRRLAATLARTPVVELARYQVHRLERVTPVSDALQKAERETPLQHRSADSQRSMKTDKARLARRRFKDRAATADRGCLRPRRVPCWQASRAIATACCRSWRHFLDQYVPVDVAFKVVGTGSVGLRDYLVYLEGNGEK